VKPAIEGTAANASYARVPVAVRAYTEVNMPTRTGARSRSGRRTRSDDQRQVPPWPTSALIFDTETTADEYQRLLFGSFRYCRWRDTSAGAGLETALEGLFYADDLPRSDPEAFAALKEYARTRAIRLMSRDSFVKRCFFPAACGVKALVVGFNLPFDLSRIAVGVGEGRGRYYGGFSFPLVDYVDSATGARREDTYFARVCVKYVDNKRSFIGFSGGREPRKGKAFRGHFLDLRTLGFALTNVGHSLRSACEAFRVTHGKLAVETHGRITAEYIDYNRRDVEASQELLARLREEFDRHPIELNPCNAYSPASIAKAYLRALGVARPRQQFPTIGSDVHGIAMRAYYGGRAEVRIRNTAVPVVYTDFLSMYPTVNALLGLWALLTADAIDVVDVTEEVNSLLGRVALDDCFNRQLWGDLSFFAEVQPRGDIFPVRAQYAEYSEAWNIGINHLESGTSWWFAGPDLVAAALLGDNAPRVLRAFRLVPRGRQQSLRSVKLAGRIEVRPESEDFFRVIIEQRKALGTRDELSETDRTRLDQFLKVLANSGSYGVFAQVDVEDLRKDETAAVTVYAIDGAFDSETSHPERSGPYFFPPIAALIPAAARLMLAMLERAVVDAGGSYALCDTDSMAIVATEHGGTIACPGGNHESVSDSPAIRALSWAQVDQIAKRFAHLSPYNRSVIPGSILKIEAVNFEELPDGGLGERRQVYLYGISAKRYALFRRKRDGSMAILKPSEHGLGHLLDPSDPHSESGDWINGAWLHVVANATGEFDEPAWLDRPAIARIAITSPALFRAVNAEPEGSYSTLVKPFNFALSAQVAPFGHPVGVDPTRFHLIAPFERNPRKWLRMQWRDIYAQCSFRIATGLHAATDCVRVKSFRDVMAEYERHPEPKSAAVDGSPCDRRTVGLLRRRRLSPSRVDYIGKEAHRIEDVSTGLVHSWRDVQPDYDNPEAERRVWGEWLRSVDRATAARALGLSERAVSALRTGKAQPGPKTLATLRRLAADARVTH
jgi:hypothetical protein